MGGLPRGITVNGGGYGLNDITLDLLSTSLLGITL